MAAKSAPLETFLTGISSQASDMNVAITGKTMSTERSMADVGRTVILTILSATGPIANEDLAARAELRPKWYGEIVGSLESDGLIERSGSSLTLTSSGIEAADRARARLLSPW